MAYITVLPTISANQLFSQKLKEPSEYFLKPNQYFNNGRSALWKCIKLLNLGPSHEVLVPATICEVVLKMFFHQGIKIQYYNLTDELDVDLKDLKKRINLNTRVIYVNHFLGYPTCIDPVREVCASFGLKLIEDCAHAFTGAYGGKLLGSLGDFSIFSYRKFLPIPDGGALVVNNSDFSKDESPVPSDTKFNKFSSILKIGMISLAKNKLIPLAWWKKIIGSENEIDEKIEYNIDLTSADKPMRIQPFSRWIMDHVNLNAQRDLRRRNYQILRDNLRLSSSLKMLFSDFPAGYVPFSFPILINKRSNLIKFSAKFGLYLEPTLAAPYRALPNLKNSKEFFPELSELAEQVVSIPVHQGLSERDMAWISKIILCGLEK